MFRFRAKDSGFFLEFEILSCFLKQFNNCGFLKSCRLSCFGFDNSQENYKVGHQQRNLYSVKSSFLRV